MLHIKQKFIVAKCSTQQTVKQVFVRHNAQVQLYKKRKNQTRILMHVFKINRRKSSRRIISTLISISQKTSRQFKCENL